MGAHPSSRNVLLIVSGPAGSGKTTLCARLLEKFSESLQRVITSTSRQPREGEVEGRDYLFFAPREFQAMVNRGEFYEWARVHDHFYGTLKQEIREKLGRGADLLMNIDVQGAATMRLAAKSDDTLRDRITTIFIQPRSIDQIRERLLLRGEDPESIDRRLQTAKDEMKQWRHFDFCIHSGDREADYKEIRSIYLSLKASRR